MMSTFEEEKYAIERTHRFLFDLLDPQITPKVPKYIRDRARQTVKHYPLSLDMFVERWYNEMSKEIQNES